MSAAVLDDYLDGLLVADVAVPAPSPPPPAPALASAEPAPPAAAPALAGTDRTASAPQATPAAAPVPRPPAPAQATQPARPAPVAPAQAMPLQPGAIDAAPPPSNRRAADRASRWLRLRCGGQAYGLELLKVQEVVLPSPLLPLRGTPAAMLGVMNLRGQVVPVMDLGVFLGQPAQPASPNTRIVVLEEKGETLGLRVSAVDDVANLTDQQIEPPDNARVGRIHNELFRGIARLAAEPMILLDASCLLLPPGGRRDAA